ncbi:MAG: ABC transporter permease [Lautropia sp.]
MTRHAARRWMVRAVQAGVVLGVCALWELSSRRGWLDATVMPSLLATAREIGRLVADAQFQREGLVTLGRVALAFAAALPFAFALGLMGSQANAVGRHAERAVGFLMTVPQSIFLPLFMLVLGTGLAQKVVFGATHIIFFVAVITIAAIKTVPRSYAMAARSFGASSLQIAGKVYVPAMFPSLVGGLRIGFLYGSLGVLLAEMYGSRQGIGVLLNQWQEAGDSVRLNAALLVVSAITIAANVLLRALEARVSHWRNGA